MRLISSEARVDGGSIKKGFIGEPEWERVISAMDRISRSPIYTIDLPGINTLEMRAKARRMKKELGEEQK